MDLAPHGDPPRKDPVTGAELFPVIGCGWKDTGVVGESKFMDALTPLYRKHYVRGRRRAHTWAVLKVEHPRGIAVEIDGHRVGYVDLAVQIEIMPRLKALKQVAGIYLLVPATMGCSDPRYIGVWLCFESRDVPLNFDDGDRRWKEVLTTALAGGYTKGLLEGEEITEIARPPTPAPLPERDAKGRFVAKDGPELRPAPRPAAVPPEERRTSTVAPATFPAAPPRPRISMAGAWAAVILPIIVVASCSMIRGAQERREMEATLARTAERAAIAEQRAQDAEVARLLAVAEERRLRELRTPEPEPTAAPTSTPAPTPQPYRFDILEYGGKTYSGLILDSSPQRIVMRTVEAGEIAFDASKCRIVQRVGDYPLDGESAQVIDLSQGPFAPTTPAAAVATASATPRPTLPASALLKPPRRHR